MSEQERAGDSSQADGALRETITMFEQILEVMPDDEMAIRTLYDSYRQVGETSKAFSMLQRLTEIVLAEDNHDLSGFLLDQFSQYEDLIDDSCVPLIERLQQFADTAPVLSEAETAETVESAGEAPALREVKIGEEDRKDAEVALVWNLYQAGMITEDDYTMILKDLTEMVSKQAMVPSTVMHVLFDRSYSHFSSVVAYMAKQSGSPFISLANFDVPGELVTLLPAEFVYHNAAIVFKKIQEDLLVAMLNPFDRKLKDAVEEMTGRTCHYYLITAEEYDGLLKKMKEAL
ncbi:MAG: hypothetical protein PHP44_00110 [Kiritimatiellae bacterium]|nr:hypothetical protein [Kiritimatiellia bacterium]MDD4734487.1 hypothetical protein [Kiritimatiellia bacterium]